MLRSPIGVPSYQRSYSGHLQQLVTDHGRERAMELIVGGKYDELGRLEAAVLQQLGLEQQHSVVDVGCGSGRLATVLHSYLDGQYWGTDILEDALAYARSRCTRETFQFMRVTRPSIPLPGETADFVVFFSVFTHLLDEDVFKYLREARRVAKPTAKIVCSFLDLESEAHWPVFLATAANEDPERILNRFTTSNALCRLARAAGLHVTVLHDGTEPWIRSVNGNLGSANAAHADEGVPFGQSVAVFDVFPETSYLARHPDVRAAVVAGQFRSGAHHYDICGHKEGRALR